MIIMQDAMRKVKIPVNLGGCGVGYYHFLDHWTHFYEEKVKLHEKILTLESYSVLLYKSVKFGVN